jgi:hypothetical protein
MPLTHLIPILVAGWKDAGITNLNDMLTFHPGLWPNENSLREEILRKRLNPEDYNLQLHLSSILDSDASPEKDVDIVLSRVLARQNTTTPKDERD